MAPYRVFGNAFGNELAITSAVNNGGLGSVLQEPWPVKKSPARGVVSVIGSVREEVRAVVLVIEKKDVACSNGYPGKRAFGPRSSVMLNEPASWLLGWPLPRNCAAR